MERAEFSIRGGAVKEWSDTPSIPVTWMMRGLSRSSAGLCFWAQVLPGGIGKNVAHRMIVVTIMSGGPNRG